MVLQRSTGKRIAREQAGGVSRIGPDYPWPARDIRDDPYIP